MTSTNRNTPPVNGPFQDALAHDYSRQIEAASSVIVHAMATKYGVTVAEVACAIARAASSERGSS